MVRTIAQTRRDALDRWWGREWPVVVLGVDPGRDAGAALVDSRVGAIRLVWANEVATSTTQLESAVFAALRYANTRGVPLVMAVEDWGAGGDRGLAQWIGLGEQRGPWIRALHLEIDACDYPGKPMVIKIPQSRWRSRLCESHGKHDSAGNWKRHDSEEWKRQAYATARRLFLDGNVGMTPNAAEAACIAYFAARADGTGKALGKRWLRKHGLALELLERQIHPDRKLRAKK